MAKIYFKKIDDGKCWEEGVKQPEPSEIAESKM